MIADIIERLNEECEQMSARIQHLQAEVARLTAERRPMPKGDRTNPAPGWAWCCTTAHSCRYLVNVDGPIKANGNRRCADTIAETWTMHDADCFPDLYARLEELEAENADLRAALEEVKRERESHVWKKLDALAEKVVDAAQSATSGSEPRV